MKVNIMDINKLSDIVSNPIWKKFMAAQSFTIFKDVLEYNRIKKEYDRIGWDLPKNLKI